MRSFLFLTFFLIIKISAVAQKYAISGIITDSISGEGLNSATIRSSSNNNFFFTNRYGFFTYQSPSYYDTILIFKENYPSKIAVIVSGIQNVVNLSAYNLHAITITDSLDNSMFVNQNQNVHITGEKIEKVPLIFGEKDITRYLSTLPGVQISSGSSSGFSVRGGNSDQNGFVFDQVPLYGISHFFGFFSSINSDIIKEADFYKGYIPSEYGGKLSSVLDIKGKEGSLTKSLLSITINPILCKFSFETPIIKNKVSLIITARRSFMDFFYKTLFSGLADYKTFRFYDVNARIKLKLNNTDNIVLSFFNSNDKFKDEDSKGSLFWGNTGVSLKYSKLLNKRLFFFATVVNSDYEFKSRLNLKPASSTFYQSKMNSALLKFYFEQYLSNYSKITYGIDLNNFQIQPSASASLDSIQLVKGYSFKPYEFTAHFDFNFKIKKAIEFKIGGRFDDFYNEQSYSKFQPRISITYNVSSKNKLFVSYSSTFQPIHQLSNTGIGLPTDIFVPSISSIKPETGDIYTLGINHTDRKRQSNINLEVFYKHMQSIIDYKPGSSFLGLSTDPDKINIPIWEDNIIQGNGRSYGLEAFYELNIPKFSINLSYTLSFSKRQFSEINFGQEYFYKDDRRHKISLSSSYNFNALNKKNSCHFSFLWEKH